MSQVNGLYTLNTSVTFNDLKKLAHLVDKVFYGAYTCWWTLDPHHLRSAPSGLPCGPRGEILYEANDPLGFLAKSQEQPHRYGKHGMRSFTLAYHGHVMRDGKLWSFRNWQAYDRLLSGIEVGTELEK